MLQKTSLVAAKDPLSDIALNQDSILGRIDEYSLYCYYLGYEPIPGRKYRSPIRTDDENPSFNIFYRTTSNGSEREFLWKDQAVGRVGDIFLLVQLMFQYDNKDQAAQRISQNFGLTTVQISDGNKISFHKAPAKTDIKIQIHSRPFTYNELAYWSKYNITPSILTEYNVTAFNFYWLMVGQVIPFSSDEYSFAYKIQDRYKLYWPFETKDKKFRNDYLRDDVEGLQQVKYQDKLLIITKSLKDVMFLKSIGLSAISPKSENTLIVTEVLETLRPRYKNIITLFDNDGKHKAEEYPFPGLELPLQHGYKDPTDLAAGLGVAMSKEIIYKLVNKYL